MSALRLSALRFATALLCLAVSPLIAAPDPAPTALLSAGTVVKLELQHHITSAYTPPDSSIYLRVAEDVLANGHVAIAKGTRVTGKITQVGARGMQGVSGSVSLDMRFVPAVDGQNVRVYAATYRAGRNRDNAVIGWSIFWGIGGLMTRGVHAHLDRGALIEAQVLSDRRVDITAEPPQEPSLAPAALSARVLSHKIPGSTGKDLRVDLERNREAKEVQFKLQWPESLAADPLAGIEMLAIDDVPVAAPARGRVLKPGEAAFTVWDIAQYCGTGTHALRLRGTSQNGVSVDYDYPIEVKIITKG